MHRLKTQGLELAVEEFGSGQPLIFAHGLTSNRSWSRRQVGALADHYRVIVFDQRGHADSTPVHDAGLFDVHRMGEDISVIIDTLGIDQVIVGGESMGAATSLRFALSHPKRVNALIQCLPALSDEPNPGRQDVQAIGEGITEKGMAAFADENMRKEIASGVSPEHARAWADILRSHETASMALACQMVPEWTVYVSSKDLQRLTMPVLLVAFDGDLVHPLALAQRMERELPRATLKIVEPASLYLETPEMVAHLIDDFLREHR